jgi:class 3 adenylate cyclase/predicted ATPase
MFCDLVDSTGLGESLDPEELRGVLGLYEDTCARVIQRFEGYVAQCRGDGLLVYFSYPQAHEDDAERAVKAGLEIVTSLRTAKPPLERDVRLRVRVGIHTGPVVVGEMGAPWRRETVALGHTLNLAARLQGIATPDSVVMSADTWRLVAGLFVTEELGSFQLKGIVHPVTAHRAIRPSGVRSRLDLVTATGLTPLVGREQDLAVLLDRWDRVCEGSSQVVLVTGEAGIGKSRLVRAFGERLAEERHTWLEFRGSPHHTNSAFHPLIEVLRDGLRFVAEGQPGDQIAWIERAVDLAEVDRETVVPVLAKLLGLPLPERYAPLELGPETQRRRTLDALVGWVCSLAKLQPTVLVLEDLQWCDPSTLELLATLIGKGPTAGILVIASSRPSVEAPWGECPHVTRLMVPPLTRRQTVAMVQAVVGDASLPTDTLDHVVRKTDGVPLFVEELTKHVLETQLCDDLAIPATLQDSLMARLDRLGPGKEIAQLGAVLGREFSYELIAAASTRAVDAALRHLTSAGLVYQRGEPPDASYTFKHALVQDAAYQSLLKERRRAWHARIAGVLAERFPHRAATEPEEVARHCEGGGLDDAAIGYYQRAAELATERSAYAEAGGHLTRAIELLGRLPESAERCAREIVLQAALGASIGVSRGWGIPEAQRSYDRARELCERFGETPQLFPALRGLVVFYTAHAELDITLDLSTRLLRLAERTRDASKLLIAHYQLGVTNYFRGDPGTSLDHFERALAHYDQAHHQWLSTVYQADPTVDLRIWMAWPLWMLGYPDRALAVSREGIEMARAAAHPFSLGYALVWTAVVHLWRGEPAMARTLSDEAVQIARERGFAVFLAGGGLTGSVARMVPGADESAIFAAMGDFQQAAADFGATGSGGAGRPHTLGALAEALASVGRTEEARIAVDAALAFSDKTPQVYWDAELHRLKGELLLRDTAVCEHAERHLRLAIARSQEQGARMLELRAIVSLGRFLRQRGDGGDIRAQLARVYGSFTEGLDTRDLVEARTLLEVLG